MTNQIDSEKVLKIKLKNQFTKKKKENCPIYILEEMKLTTSSYTSSLELHILQAQIRKGKEWSDISIPTGQDHQTK